MAQLWKLPVIYVCENNLYNEYTHSREATAGEFTARAAAFAIENAEVDGQDVRAVYAAAARLVARARGPRSCCARRIVIAGITSATSTAHTIARRRKNRNG